MVKLNAVQKQKELFTKYFFPIHLLRKKNIFFKISARMYNQKKPLHHGSFWYYLSQTQWDHYIDSLLTPIKDDIKSEAAVFEVGMGCGAVLKRVKETNPHVSLHGIDPEKKAIKLAQKHLSDGKYSVGNGLDMLHIKDNKYDIVLAHCVIIYLKNLTQVKKFCDEIIRIAKPGAKIMITSMVDKDGKKLGTGRIKIPKTWWSKNLKGATLDQMINIGEIPGCEHQEDRYAVYLTKSI